MNKLTLPTLALATLVAQTAQAGMYVGAKSTEANYAFRAQVEMTQKSKPTQKQALAAIEAQVQHLHGPWSSGSEKASPKENHRIEILSIDAEVNPGRFTVSYAYAGTIVLEQKTWGRTAGDSGTFDAFLPVNPKEVYERGLVGETNPCTDRHYQAEGDFWYFWNPKNYGCKLQEGTDYLRVAGEFVRFKNTVETYPEYHRLADPTTGKIEIVLFFGMDDPEAHVIDPDTSRDVNAPNYRALKQELMTLGYTARKLGEREKAALISSPRALEEAFTLERLTKKTPKGEMDILLYYGATGMDEKSSAFHHLYKRALEKSAVMLYNGHSGLGGHLDIRAMEQAQGFDISLPRSRYQIYYFNSCTSYTYYNLEYMKRKRSPTDRAGTKNLDIFANGLATYFHVMHETDMALIRAIDAYATRGEWKSYQQLAREIDSDNLFGINGDEDNPVHPIKD